MLISADRSSFFQAWLRDPLRVAAVAPSSGALARLITGELRPGMGAVLELGPGTGAFTAALVAKGFEERDLTLVEMGEDFARLLAARYPGAVLVRADAARRELGALLPARRHAATVSGLPLLSMGPKRVIGVLRTAFAAMERGGAFYQFTYAWRCPVPDAILDRLGLSAVRIGSVVGNLPPASVYRLSRRR
ncbi:SAM-dependent methyltransferase [Aureimonas endophytica]|uniref:SAM-dependent methyltransferase n=1 Tax=Aureimonas endophytica TaxID=2027858 RepID=A0A917EDB0_9HYPH|nr:rRNA adenine N-6-methyltransferase family protein [Aureimonas endophytica]GGE21204.1 SAM-dependent methyltransferase [Aureimonas endophytica]